MEIQNDSDPLTNVFGASIENDQFDKDELISQLDTSQWKAAK
jgi:hypothetical protein